ncbi:hypothetical protein [Halalkalicoccus jeotgali]|uniref:DUF35 domain-containing protein n=1 Tax=Halalkalicoccus jeotgali (strain DSM 18796 / CECT 7217 / JCM 14584 / KCTC 4019 / B3) TaxID=795797 RepID=D8J9D1_HALJB|nr:hypothetical protein [Halalkalicoccus jeotgali]ADJ14343.1 hypothetical protein HacjB3_04760 [Halalkalicoccus jeotgali B3]ELY40606.1 hypothetical protein C497_03127 [Halalkalicoccus jeotgali B3]
MGIFRKVGRQVEQFKRTATETAKENADYRCRECDARFDVHDGRCPECGAPEVVSVGDEE